MLDVRDSVAVITFDNTAPPGSRDTSTGHVLRLLTAAQQDPSVSGIVLMGDAETFAAGADAEVSDGSTSVEAASLSDVIARIEASAKPVVAAIEGEAIGASLELALACHGRVALETAPIGFPEVGQGLLPRNGGSQRLFRLIGVDAAMKLLIGPGYLPASTFASSGLFADVVSVHVVEAATRLAKALADADTPLSRARDRQLDDEATVASIDVHRGEFNAKQKLQPVYGALLDAANAAVLPFEQGLQLESELLRSLEASTASRALRYLGEQEVAATCLPPEYAAAPRVVKCVAIIGAGTMGSGIAISVLDAGLSVLLLEQSSEALDRGWRRIDDYYRARVSSGKLKAVKAAGNMQRLVTTTEWPKLAEADVVIEAVFEDLAVKLEVFRKVDIHARPGAVLATNTSYLDVDAIASATTRPSDFLGLHFFSPANVMKLLEVVRGKDTSAQALATGMWLGTKLKKMPVMTGNAFGFIGNRIYNAYRRQCEFMLEDGAWPEDVDRALTSMGFAMGPFAVADLSGLDIAWRMRKSQAANRDPRERYVAILDRLCEMDRLGRKTGAGYYRYSEGKQSSGSDDVVRSVIEQASRDRDIERRTLTVAEIQRRALLAMVNEAALLVAEGVASRPSDVDVVLIQGYGFPRWEGGPVFWARNQERGQLEADLQLMAREAGHGFAVGNLNVLFAD